MSCLTLDSLTFCNLAMSAVLSTSFDFSLIVMINRFYKNADMNNATGFLYHGDDGKRWLVTAKHILFSCMYNGLPFTMINVMLSRTKSSTFLPIKLPDILNYGKVHVNEHVDIALIELSQLFEGRYQVQKEYSTFKYFIDSTVSSRGNIHMCDTNCCCDAATL